MAIFLTNNRDVVSYSGSLTGVDVRAFGGDDDVTGSSHDDILNGGNGYDILFGGDGNDTLIDYGPSGGKMQGGMGEDQIFTSTSCELDGGWGNDTYHLYVGAEAVTFAGSDGDVDTVLAEFNFSLAVSNELENLTLLGLTIYGTGNTAANVITGNAGGNILDGGDGADTLYGLVGSDTLTGGEGADALVGGSGNDVYYADAFDTIIEEAGRGDDTIKTADNYSLAALANVERLTLLDGAVYGTGNGLANVITGNSGNNTLTGGDGMDKLVGASGDDTYILEDITNVLGSDRYDVIYETGIGGGTDEVYVGREASKAVFGTFVTSYTLGDNIERGTVSGTEDFDLTGNASSNILNGNDAANVLNGGLGSDTLNGKHGADVLNGGAGNDTYILADAARYNFNSYFYDTVNEAAGEGNDTVIVYRVPAGTFEILNYALGANIENAVVSGSGDFDLMGNELSNRLTGNDSANGLSGGSGDAGDILKGMGGNDFLTGGGGADKMYGGSGDDVYIFDNAGDVAIEVVSDAGIDRVESYVGVTLAAGIENLVLYGNTSIDGAGNALDNFLNGNLGDNVLNGGDGADQVYGYDGADKLDGGNDNDQLFGGSGSDVLSGGYGFDTLNGGAGRDELTGHDAGVYEADHFVFAAASESGNSAATRDVIFNFNAIDPLNQLIDVIDISQIDAKFNAAGNNAFTYIGVGTAFTHEGEVRAIQDGANTILEFNVLQLGTPEFQIELRNTAAADIGADNFVL